MIRLLSIFTIGIAISQATLAQRDPCVVVGGSNQVGGGPSSFMCGPGPDLQFLQGDAVMAANGALAVIELRALVAEIRGLRQEMKTYSDGLAQARAKFDTTSKETALAQEKWRTDALNQTLSDIAAVPVRLGSNEALRGALLLALKEALPKDQEFLKALKAASKD